MKTLLPSAVTRRQHTSPRGSHPVDFRPWRWFILSALLLAAATFGGVFFGIVQAQDANGAINGLTLSSDSPGDSHGLLGRAQPRAHRLPRGLGEVRRELPVL